MAKFASLSVMFIAAMVIAIVASHAEAVVTCGTVATDLSPCLDYVRMGGAIPTMCCNGIRNLFSAASTTQDRQTVCNCMKSAARVISGVNLNLAAALPSKCGVIIPYKISPSIDCAKVQ
ncbi:non-specific lipid-transfer protein 1-like [Nicotiana tabacum]|uniref:Non-specific lipid-transfer protein n=2 Tax=Nicotiana TaxID=4085 RepID=A0A1S4DB48_TOBAC|nr:PREDICTED: non-specific lipid-transfer protein 1-like [Nicotiana sylvestris]XP_016510583.1 PREDICTED: non-specific lipid-transfer protein 1-like [Nicotiana tabacum]